MKSFGELLRDNFFDLSLNKNLTPTQLINSRNGVSVCECKKDTKTYAMRIIELNAREKKSIQDEVVSLLELNSFNKDIVNIKDYFISDQRMHIILEYYSEGKLKDYALRREAEKRLLSYDVIVWKLLRAIINMITSYIKI
jgi:serine/threonine protein kinase